MTVTEIIEENLCLLSYVWQRIKGRTRPESIGLTAMAGSVVDSLNDARVRTAADTAVPLFDFAITPDMLRAALDRPHNQDQLSRVTELFLLNRWRLAGQSSTVWTNITGASLEFRQILRDASFTQVKAAATSGANFFTLAVAPQFLKLAGIRSDLSRGHRTIYAHCARPIVNSELA